MGRLCVLRRAVCRDGGLLSRSSRSSTSLSLPPTSPEREACRAACRRVTPGLGGRPSSHESVQYNHMQTCECNMPQTRARDPNCTRECVCPSGPVDREATRGVCGLAQPARHSLEESISSYNPMATVPPLILRWSSTSRFVASYSIRSCRQLGCRAARVRLLAANLLRWSTCAPPRIKTV